MTDDTLLEWLPPSGSPLSWSVPDGTLLQLRGTEDHRTSLLTRKGPRQRGSSATGRNVDDRTVAALVKIKASSPAELFEREEQHRNALANDDLGDEPRLGVLRVTRPGRGTREIRAEPVESPVLARRLNPRQAEYDVEWHCPQPDWRETSDRFVSFDADAAGLLIPLLVPLSFERHLAEQDVVNPGRLAVPCRVRFRGPQTDPRAVLPEHGVEIRLNGTVPAGAFAEVNTGTDGRRSVELVADGVRTNWLNRWARGVSTWVQVPSGTSRWRWQPGSSDSGASMSLFFRAAWPGV